MGMVLLIEGDNHSGCGDDIVISILLNGIKTRRRLAVVLVVIILSPLLLIVGYYSLLINS